jgi:hypothetical protein
MIELLTIVDPTGTFEVGEELKTLQIPFRTSMYAMKMYKLETGKSVKDITGEDYEEIEILLYYSIEAAYKIMNKEMPFTKKQVIEFADQVYLQFFEKIPEFFSTKKTPATIAKKTTTKK